MAEFLSWSRLFEAGGVTLIILILCSIVSFIVIIERLIYFNARTIDPQKLIEKARPHLGAGALPEDLTVTPAGYVLNECLQVSRRGSGGLDKDFEEIKGRAIAEKIPEMERYLNIEATLGTVSPYIGLLGTVLGIITAFTGLSGGAGNDPESMSTLNRGIAEALIATAGGLIVAIPATIAYNYFRKRVTDMILAIEVAASRLKQIIRETV